MFAIEIPHGKTNFIASAHYTMDGQLVQGIATSNIVLRLSSGGGGGGGVTNKD